jgi:membrane-associated phospholipid phosphatase
MNRSIAFAALLCACFFARAAAADPIVIPQRCTGKQLCWAPTFNRMDVPEMIVTGVAASIAIATNVAPPLNTGWTGGILFDDAVRSALRLSSYDAQLEVRTGSDLALAVLTSYPILVDSLIVAYWYRGSADVALQMALIDAEALAIAGAVQGASNFFAGRQRPYGSACATGIPANTTDCSTDTLHRSFFSGHTVLGFTGAALICAHHEALRLFDNAGADHLACISAMTAASAIGVMRIMGDAHYFSDVFVGALVGTAIGLGVPLLHHYKRQSSSKTPAITATLVPTVGGAQIVGTW